MNNTQSGFPHWRPRSLYQLALLGFVVVWVPLVIAIAYTGYRFHELATTGNKLAQDLVFLTRANQQLQTTMLELERRAGQYLVLRDEDVERLYTKEHQRLVGLLGQLQKVLPKASQYQILAMQESLGRLQLAALAPQEMVDKQVVLGLISQLQEQLADFEQSTTASVDKQIADSVQQAARSRVLLIVMTLALALVSLLAAWYFLRSIKRPVRELEQEIQRLGDGDLSKVITIHGPEEMQQLSQQLNWLRIRLAEIDAQKQQFLRHMSHELKTPLSSLREGADLLAEGVIGRLEPQQAEIVAILQQNSLELQRLIENLLDYNQMLQQRQLTLVEIDVAGLQEELLRQYRISIQRQSLTVEIQHQVAGPILADRTKLRTIVDNLISNAVNYSPTGGEILLQTEQADNTLVIRVANQGEPIPESDQLRIFEPFYQGARTREGAIKGSGIGLAVAAECAAIHQGQLGLTQLPGYAVCFQLRLPLEKV